MKYYFHKAKNKERSFRVIIRKAKSNSTGNFSLWNCDKTLPELKKLFEKILVIDKEKYFTENYKIIDNWGSHIENYSHYCIIQDFRPSLAVKNSLCIGLMLHNWDSDEIKEVLLGIFCNKLTNENEVEK
jgi:hypothetical protein